MDENTRKRVNVHAYCALLGCTVAEMIAYAVDGTLRDRLVYAAEARQGDHA